MKAVGTERFAESEPVMRQVSLFVGGMGCRRGVREVELDPQPPPSPT